MTLTFASLTFNFFWGIGCDVRDQTSYQIWAKSNNPRRVTAI